MGIATDLERMREQQAVAAAEMAGGLSPADEFACKLGIQDALKEEVLLLTEECRCDCVNCVTGNHQDCYYWPRELCCPFPRVCKKQLTERS